MPSANKARAVFDNGKTASYHVTTIANCSQSSKNSALFKLILNRAGANPPKRYDFEAENPKLAGMILFYRRPSFVEHCFLNQRTLWRASEI